MSKIKVYLPDIQQPIEGVLIDNLTYIPLRPVFEALGMKVDYDEAKREVRVTNKPADPLNKYYPSKQPGLPLAGKIIALDRGHLIGVDPGAVDPIDIKNNDHINSIEAAMNNDYAYDIRIRLEAKGATVFLTTGKDLSERVKQAKKAGAHILVSNHMNRVANAQPEGREILHNSTPDSLRLASVIEEEIALKLPTQKSRGLKLRADLSLLNWSKYLDIPVALIEIGFISNVKEEGLLHEAGFRKLAAEGIVEGIVKYFG